MEIAKEYSRAYVEVLEIIKQLNKDDYNKIPKERIEIYEEYKDKSYKFKYNKNVELREQISFEAKNVLSNLFLNYIATKNDRKEIYDRERKEWLIKERQKPKYEIQYDKTETKAQENNKEGELVSARNNQNFFMKLINKIKKFFRKV